MSNIHIIDKLADIYAMYLTRLCMHVVLNLLTNFGYQMYVTE